MNNLHTRYWSRRDFLGGLLATGSGALLGLNPGKSSASGEPPPETTRIRLVQLGSACWAPQYVAEALLYKEGFKDVQFIKGKGGKQGDMLLNTGQLDISLGFSARQIKGVEPGNPTVFLSGLHAGCYSLIGSEHVRSVPDLKGRTVWAGRYPDSGPHIFFSTLVSYVGLDPVKDIHYSTVPKDEAIRQFLDGKIDAFMSFAPEPQELRDKGIGRVLVDTNVDRPWSEYFCCLIAGHRDFIQRNPVATRRALRAILSSNDIVHANPELAARTLIQHQVRKASEYDITVAALKEIPYHTWREYNPEDTLRFYALRLRDTGLIRTNPQEIIAQNSDWSFLRGLEQDLNLSW